MRIHNYTVFPQIITETECDLYNSIRNDLINWIYNYQSKTETVLHSNRGGWQSPDNFYNDESFLKFKQYILDHIFQSLTHYNIQFKLNNMWININKKDNYNIAHAHPGSHLSGVFWIKASDKCGNLVFNNPHSFVSHRLIRSTDDELKRKINYTTKFYFKPTEGTLVLFPSHLQHYVESNESDEDRISISFNLS